MLRDNRDNRESIDVNEIIRRLPSAMDKTRDPNGNELFYCAENVGLLLRKKDISVSQIRKVFNEAMKIEYDDEGPYRLKMLKAGIAYTAGRFGKKMDEFKLIFSTAIDLAEKDADSLKRFKDFFEAVIAYHRAYGGRE